MRTPIRVEKKSPETRPTVARLSQYYAHVEHMQDPVPCEKQSQTSGYWKIPFENLNVQASDIRLAQNENYNL